MDLEDRSVVVTGASSGIGRGVARRFAEAGAAVTVGDVREAPKRGDRYDSDATTPTHELVREAGGEAQFVETDVADPDDCEALIDAAVEAFGGLDVLVNNAGIHVPGDVREVSLADWRTVVEVNLFGQFYCAKFAVPHLEESGGAVVNVASVNAVEGGAGPPYAASKAGIVNLTRDLATTLGPAGVNVNAVCPGYVETPLQDYLTDEEVAAAREQTVLPRFGTPEDVAEAALFLASDRAEWITGEALFVDGGWTAHR
ncbi:MAG: SDR family NAD(P)-dependent oxidoreductase [Halobacteriaceae archaeon]